MTRVSYSTQPKSTDTENSIITTKGIKFKIPMRWMKNIYRISILAPSPFLPIGEFDGVSDVPVPPDFVAPPK